MGIGKIFKETYNSFIGVEKSLLNNIGSNLLLSFKSLSSEDLDALAKI